MALGTNTQLSSHLGRHSVTGHWRPRKTAMTGYRNRTMCRFSLRKGLPKKVLTGEDAGGKSLSNRIEN